jgi:hypothetical protein
VNRIFSKKGNDVNVKPNSEEQATILLQGDNDAVKKRALNLVREGYAPEVAAQKARSEEVDEQEIRWRMTAGLSREQATAVVAQQRAEDRTEAELKAALAAK